jgi:hypothetical protein
MWDERAFPFLFFKTAHSGKDRRLSLHKIVIKFMIIYFLSSSDLCTQRQPARVIWALLGKDQARPAVVVNYQVSTNFSCNQHKSGADLKSKSSLKAERRHFQRSLWMIIYNQQRAGLRGKKKKCPEESREEGPWRVKLSEGRKITFEGGCRKESFIPPTVNCCSFSPNENRLMLGKFFPSSGMIQSFFPQIATC